MSGRIPPIARDVLDRARFCHLAVRTSWGPHLTPVVFAFAGGSLWMTTSRSSVKARAWRSDPTVAGLVSDGEVAVAFRGGARTYDALDPFTWPAAAVGAPSLARAAARFTAKNLRFFAGYAVDARRVPLSWTPPGRVFVRVDLAAGRVMGGPSAVEGWGEWPASIASKATFGQPRRARPLDLRVPQGVRGGAGLSLGRGKGAFAVADPELAVVPARWRRVPSEGAYEIAVGRAHAELFGGDNSAFRAALTIDRASVWRAAEMRGLLLQGSAEAFDPARVRSGRRRLRERLDAVGAMRGDRADDPGLLIRLRPDRIVWWEGWAGGAVVGDDPGRAGGSTPVTRGSPQ